MSIPIINEVWLEFSLYHTQIVVKAKFSRPSFNLPTTGTSAVIEESALMNLAELESFLWCWREDALLGSFGIGTRLAQGATIHYIQKV